MVLIELETGFHLIFVIGDPAWSFMVTNEFHANFFSIIGNRFDIKVLIAFGKWEKLWVGNPVAVPANNPAFNKHAVKTVICCKIHVGFGSFSGGTMDIISAPGVFTNVHAPPNTDVFAWVNPICAFELVGFVEV